MTRRVLVGLSSPTFFDYQHQAVRSSNDTTSSPNPVLENAFGLAVFYDEVWFLCESLCPQSLRGHPSVKYLDKYLSGEGRSPLADACRPHLPITYSNELIPAKKAIATNFQSYWPRIRQAGVYWDQDDGVALDNHTHQLNILGVHTSANSNSAERLVADLRIREVLKDHLSFDLAMNSFTTKIYDALYPSQYDPLTDIGARTVCSTAVINAMVKNTITLAGPTPEVFDLAAASSYSSQFRAYIDAKEIADAYACYDEITREIEQAIDQAVLKAADRVHPTRGLVQIVCEAVMDSIPGSTFLKAAGLYAAQVSPRPVSAAAFMLDLQRAKPRIWRQQPA